MNLDRLPAEVQDLAVLPYTIHSSSGYTASYSPDHILVDQPSDQSSRWTGAISEPAPSRGHDALVSARNDKYVMIKLDEPADLRFVGFGKYFKVHPCNLSSFAVYGGMSPERQDQHLLYYGGLRNDTEKEKFELDTSIVYRGDRYSFPVQYVRIDAIAAHSQSYNVSIWHVWLEGNFRKESVAALYESYEAYRSQLANDMVLSFLRRNNSLDLFERARSGLKAPRALEHPLLGQLHDLFVVKGDFDRAESLLERMKEEQLFKWWAETRARPKGRWVQFEQTCNNNNNNNNKPGPRGGHQMVRTGRTIILYGGWDGKKDLDDLWELDLRTVDEARARVEWRKVECDPKPRARSCHQLAVDRSDGLVYLLGGMAPVDERGVELTGPEAQANDLWVYDPANHRWTCLSKDVAAQGGPPLLFDHQMVVDPGESLYVFGGKFAMADGSSSEESRFSSLWKYEFGSNKWGQLEVDANAFINNNGDLRTTMVPPGRIGHAAQLLEGPGDGQLRIRIMSGQRGEGYMTDVWDVTIPSKDGGRELKYERVTSDFTLGGNGPYAGFTQRLVRLDENRSVLLTGLVRDGNREVSSSSVWICTHAPGEEMNWSRVRDVDPPKPRYAAQCVDDGRENVWLSGGNPGDADMSLRLGDLWRLSIEMPNQDWAIRRVMFVLRRQRFSELCKREPSVLALAYLQTQVAEVVDHTSPSEATEFRECMKDLLDVPAANERANEVTEMDWDNNNNDDDHASAEEDKLLPNGVDDGSFYAERQKRFEEIASMFEPKDRPPLEDLKDILGAARRHWDP